MKTLYWCARILFCWHDMLFFSGQLPLTDPSYVMFVTAVRKRPLYCMLMSECLIQHSTNNNVSFLFCHSLSAPLCTVRPCFCCWSPRSIVFGALPAFHQLLSLLGCSFLVAFGLSLPFICPWSPALGLACSSLSALASTFPASSPACLLISAPC